MQRGEKGGPRSVRWLCRLCEVAICGATSGAYSEWWVCVSLSGCYAFGALCAGDEFFTVCVYKLGLLYVVAQWSPSCSVYKLGLLPLVYGNRDQQGIGLWDSCYGEWGSTRKCV